MAGESPDRSEQRKSSGETTRGERDPRLTDRREAEGAPKSAAERESAARAASRATPGGVDRSEEPDGASKAASGPLGRTGGSDGRSRATGAENGASSASTRTGAAPGARPEAELGSGSASRAVSATDETGQAEGAAEGGPARNGSGRGSARNGSTPDNGSDAGAGAGAHAEGQDRATAVFRTGALPTRHGTGPAETEADQTDADTEADTEADQPDADADAEADQPDTHADTGSAAAGSGAEASAETAADTYTAGSDTAAAAPRASAGSATGSTPSSPSMQDSVSGSDPASAAGSDARADAGSGAVSKVGGGQVTPGGDARLRAAVAAWVAKAGTDEADDETGEGSANGAQEGARDDRTSARNDAAVSTTADTADTDSATGSGSRSTSGSGPDSGSGSGAGSTVTGAASADSVTDDSTKDFPDDSAAGPFDAVAGKPSDRATAVFGAVRGAAAGNRAAQRGDADDRADAKRGEADSDRGGDRGGERAFGSGGDAQPVDSPTSVFGTVRPKDRNGAGAKGDTDASASGPTTKDADKGVGKDTARGAEKDTNIDTGTSTDTSAGTGTDISTGTGTDTGASARPVDRPTAVFKALRPSDAPRAPGAAAAGAGTTAGQRPDNGQGAGADRRRGAGQGAGASAGDAGQSAPSVERTSQFVPLKSADERPAKPAAAASGKGAAGTAAGTQPGTRRQPGGKPQPGEQAGAGAGVVPGTESTKQQPTLPTPGAGFPTPKTGAAPGGAGAAAAGTAAGTAGTGTAAGAAGTGTGASAAPLDLLAQLTNTPPPPKTLTRTVVRRVKIWTPLVLVLAILFGIAQSVRPLPAPELNLTANETFSFDGAKPSMPWPGSGQAVVEVEGLGSLGAYGEQKPAPIASVAKVMTAYVIMRDHPMKAGADGPKITIDAKAAADAGKAADGESVVKVDEGAKITQREAIEGIMIASANNVARLLARWDSGSEAEFVKKMNEAAKSLGMKNTTYTDPSGLNATTVSTAADQVKLAKKAMDDPTFREVVKMPKYNDSRGDEHGNWNRLVPFNGVVGIKTGTTTKAGGNLVFAAEKKIGGTKQLIIGAVLSQPPAKRDNSILTGVLDASKKLILEAQDTLQDRKVVKKGDVVGEVDDGLGGKTQVIAVKDVTAVGWSGLTVNLELTDGGESLPHEAKAGTVVGTLTVGHGPGQVKVPVALKDALSEPSFGAKLIRIT
ncbi:D-alanyl-D-alanine carboxypeptidase [Streptomyces zagrosensis]|uniref:D-alanyl-D-alanine carboxypeptidase n=1 Tax=Streptomyces zagrosensis TaxID=1042984 RepID=A0A7W9QGZ9_9ACTN|nr:D-alanyl-D-alanine carboxypeptidase [Streptomyces zagrosensis]MBB5939849.1 D-alanyl-D-alanine carboxypeptidase [Streptomyces zagrosensis]